jgi:hypothetical protein
MAMMSEWRRCQRKKSQTFGGQTLGLWLTAASGDVRLALQALHPGNLRLSP